MAELHKPSLALTKNVLSPVNSMTDAVSLLHVTAAVAPSPSPVMATVNVRRSFLLKTAFKPFTQTLTDRFHYSNNVRVKV